MKTLDTIQKTCKVFSIIAEIVMILSFVWVGLSAIGMVCCLISHFVGMPDFIAEILAEQNYSAIKGVGILLADIVFGVTDGILFFFTYRYLKQELTDGTPFTIEGADRVKSLGIKAIVMPLVAVIVSAIIYACFGITHIDRLSNGTAILLGIALILVSLILRHGAELGESQSKKDNESTGEHNVAIDS